MMRKFTLALSLAAFVGWAGSAPAADLPGLKDMAPLPPPPPIWTGFYIGVGVGGGAAVSEWKYDHHKCWGPCDGTNGKWENGKIDGLGGDGFLGTLQIGYDWQANPRFVVGAFADIDRTNMDFSRSFANGFDGADWGYSESWSVDVNYMWTIGARFGYLMTPNSLWYVFAGYSQLDVDSPKFNKYGPDGLITPYPGYRYHLGNLDGWSVGTGIETLIKPNWSLKVEYRYSQFDSNNALNFNYLPLYDGDMCVDTYSCKEHHFREKLDANIHTGRLVLSYRPQFGPPPLEPLK